MRIGFIVLIALILIFSAFIVFKNIGNFGRSNYFSDPISQEILTGKKTYDMSSFNLLCGPGSSAKSDEYGFKIINAFKQLGYFFSSGACGEKLNINNKDNVSVILLNAYQRYNNFSESNYIDKKVLWKLNGQLRKSEKRDAPLAKKFICYHTIKNTPPNDASREHRAFLLNLAMSIFPDNLKIKEQDCINSQLCGLTSCDENSFPGYWLGYDDNCNLINNFDILDLPHDDYTLVSSFIHEYIHFLDCSNFQLQSPYCIDTRTFYDISYDTNDKITESWDFYRPRINMNDDNQLKNNFFSYGEGWISLNHPEYYTPHEDFAVSVQMYVTNGIVFRDYMEDKPILIKKYNWIKEKVFNGRQFNTGDKNYASYVPDLSSRGLSGTGVVSAAGITELRLDYKWDYLLK
jgi:hypothetical protein